MFSDEAVDPRRDKRNLGRRDALQKLEFMPPRVEMRDFVARRFQLSLQIENFRARFRIKIRRGKCGFQFDDLQSSQFYRIL